MKPPYDITPLILKKISSISEKIGEVNAQYLSRPSPTLRKQNRIRTIHSPLKIEGNSAIKVYDYMNLLKEISSAMASRNIRKGVDLNYFKKSGDKNQSLYKVTLGN